MGGWLNRPRNGYWQWNSFDQLFVGEHGDGTLNVEAGGVVSNTNGWIAFETGSTGIATVTGSGSQWNNLGLLAVGWKDNGTLNVQNGGLITNTDGYIGRVAQGVATINGAGSQWNNSGFLRVGDRDDGDGTLNVEAGGVVSNTSGYIGFDPGSTGIATVTGGGSQWNNSGDLNIGNGGTGTLNINDSGLVSVTGTTKLWSGDDTLNIDGGSLATGSFDRTNGTFAFNDGSLTVNGGTFINGGIFSPTSGSLEIDGSSLSKLPTLNITNGATTSGIYSLDIATIHQGALNISDGGVASASVGQIGGSAGSTGTVTVTGAGSQLNSYDLLVGRQGNGNLIVQDGGLVSTEQGFIGTNGGSTGTASVTGANSQLNSSYGLYLGGNATDNGGTGTLNINDHGLVSVTGTTKLWSSDDTLNIDGGTLTTDSLDNSNGGSVILSDGLVMVADLITPGSGFEMTGGKLEASMMLGDFTLTGGLFAVDTVAGNLTQNGGTVAPGDSPGTTTVTGNYDLNGGSIEMELGGLTQGIEFDFVAIADDFVITNGTLDVSLLGSFDPESGNVFDLFDFGTQTGTFTAVNLPTLSSGLNWDTTELYTSGSLSVSAVPEPTSLLMFASAGLLFIQRRRR